MNSEHKEDGSATDARLAARGVLRDRVGYVINEQKFRNWKLIWDSKQAVIDHLLEELEKSMYASQGHLQHNLKLICDAGSEVEIDARETSTNENS